MIKNAQSSIYNALRSLPYGDLFIAIAPIFIGIEALERVLFILGFGIPAFFSCLFSLFYYVYIVAMIAAFATDKLYFIFGIFGLKSLDNFIDIFKQIFAEYKSAYSIWISIIGFIGYGALAFLFYYIYTKKQNEA